VIGQQVLPAYDRLARFMRDEVQPNARQSTAAATCPAARPSTPNACAPSPRCQFSAAQVHEQGRSEVARILATCTG
jgi:uncharacterized protein (DUF885 family)